jgi:hypothetical protein
MDDRKEICFRRVSIKTDADHEDKSLKKYLNCSSSNNTLVE